MTAVDISCFGDIIKIYKQIERYEKMRFFHPGNQRRHLPAIIAVILLLCSVSENRFIAHADGQEQPARNIVTQCDVSATSYGGEIDYLWNELWGGIFEVRGGGRHSINVDLNGHDAQGIYIRWAKGPSPWRIEITLRDGRLLTEDHGKNGFLQEYVTLPADTAGFSIVTDDASAHPIRMVELEVYSPGVLPDSVHIWEPTPSRAEIMFIATHQDDEILYFGGAIPYYAGELNYDTVVVYTAFDSSRRLHEALEGLWVCGATQYPVFLDYPDRYSMTIEEALESWNEAEVTKSLTELLVRYQPQVVVSQDIDGEYGHGQHKLTVHCVRQALNKAEDPDYVSGNFPEATTWSVSKCYLHLYRKNAISMPWDKLTMTSAGGKTTLEIARRAFLCHASQQEFDYEVSTTAEGYDCRSFGLYRSSVGEDVNKNDFFENITLRTLQAQPQEALPDYLERIGTTGWFCRCTAERWLQSEYMRYCTVDGVTGWYASDSTGVVQQPLQTVQLVMDDITLDTSAYQTLTQIKDKPRLYSYSDGVMVEDQIVRYCSVGAGEPGFYCTDENGMLTQPAVQVSVSPEKLKKPADAGMVYVQTWEQAADVEDPSRDVSRSIIILCSALLVVTALALSVSVARLCAINKKRRYRRR